MHLHLNFLKVRSPAPDSALQPAKLRSANLPVPDSCLPRGPDFRNAACLADAKRRLLATKTTGVNQTSYKFFQRGHPD